MHLDAKGLVALWREGLLARHVLLGVTKGYRHHPQLQRFRALSRPVLAVDSYLSRVLDEADARGYSFDRSKIEHGRNCRIRVTRGQVDYEWQHLMGKLRTRDPDTYRKWLKGTPRVHPCFFIVPGPIQEWERPL